jgi:two-component system NtrC family response regulator
LLESELFGHERGAFTGAVQQRRGKVEYAQGGTLFLDEVGELSPALQVKLLRFLQDHTVERIGGRQRIEVDTRIIAATNVDLKRAIEQGSFREDLYYRLGVVSVHLPPLRERGDDVLLMARVFLHRARVQFHKRIQGFTRDAVEAVHTYSWPGNIRELLNKVRRAVVLAEGPYLTREDLDLPGPTGTSPSGGAVSLREARQRLEADFILQALTFHNGNLSRVADDLKISRPTLYKLIRKYGLRDKIRLDKLLAGSALCAPAPCSDSPEGRG